MLLTIEICIANGSVRKRCFDPQNWSQKYSNSLTNSLTNIWAVHKLK